MTFCAFDECDQPALADDFFCEGHRDQQMGALRGLGGREARLTRPLAELPDSFEDLSLRDAHLLGEGMPVGVMNARRLVFDKPGHYSIEWQAHAHVKRRGEDCALLVMTQRGFFSGDFEQGDEVVFSLPCELVALQYVERPKLPSTLPPPPDGES